MRLVRWYRPEQIVITGESLGGGVAVRNLSAADVCRAGQQPHGLLLVATFDSMLNAAGVPFSVGAGRAFAAGSLAFRPAYRGCELPDCAVPRRSGLGGPAAG
ncbi:MAG UNVERIFIED_CONTAM: lipase family protein [Planctomycetaceae bacterium]